MFCARSLKSETWCVLYILHLYMYIYICIYIHQHQFGLVIFQESCILVIDKCSYLNLSYCRFYWNIVSGSKLSLHSFSRNMKWQRTLISPVSVLKHGDMLRLPQVTEIYWKDCWGRKGIQTESISAVVVK